MVLCRDADVNQFEDDGATPVICLKEQGEVRIIYLIVIFFKTKLLLSELFTFFFFQSLSIIKSQTRYTNPCPFIYYYFLSNYVAINKHVNNNGGSTYIFSSDQTYFIHV